MCASAGNVNITTPPPPTPMRGVASTESTLYQKTQETPPRLPVRWQKLAEKHRAIKRWEWFWFKRLCPTDFYGELCLFLSQTTSKSTLYFSPEHIKKEAHFPIAELADINST